MNCKEAENFLDAYVDGELDLVRSLEIETHLQSCPSCPKMRESWLALRSALGSGALYFNAPAGLQRRIRAALPGRPRQTRWLVAAAAAACLAAIAFWTVQPRRHQEETIAREVVASHIRSLMPNHLTDVESSDQHTVKPWFSGKVDFSPPVKDGAAAGFPLAGARLDYLDGRPVSALVYQRRKHLINVFIWPAAREQEQKAGSRQGYNLLHWARDGMTYWAVSDLNRVELEQLAALLK